MRRADARLPSSAERVLKIGNISSLVAPGGGFNPVHGMSVFFDSKSSVILVEYSPAQPGPCDGAVLLDDRLCVSRGTVLVMAVAEEDPKVRWARPEGQIAPRFLMGWTHREDLRLYCGISLNQSTSLQTTHTSLQPRAGESLCSLTGSTREVGGACSRAVCGRVWRRAGRQSIWLEKSWQPCWVRQVCESCVSVPRVADGCHMQTSSPCPVCRTRW